MALANWAFGMMATIVWIVFSMWMVFRKKQIVWCSKNVISLSNVKKTKTSFSQVIFVGASRFEQLNQASEWLLRKSSKNYYPDYLRLSKHGRSGILIWSLSQPRQFHDYLGMAKTCNAIKHQGVLCLGLLPGLWRLYPVVNVFFQQDSVPYYLIWSDK